MTLKKYPLEHKAEQVVNLPYGAEIQSVLPAGDELFLRAIVDADERAGEPRQARHTILLFGDGDEISQKDRLYPINPFTAADGRVWHAFEMI